MGKAEVCCTDVGKAEVCCIDVEQNCSLYVKLVMGETGRLAVLRTQSLVWLGKSSELTDKALALSWDV